MKMTEDQARKLLAQAFPKVSETVRKRNPGIYGSSVVTKPEPGKRMRQDTKPRLNKLETAFLNEVLKYRFSESIIREQAIRFELANGIWYKPDFVVFIRGFDSQDTRQRAFEVKGPKAWRGGFENLKVAARVWPMIRWTLVWKENGQWKEQGVMP